MMQLCENLKKKNNRNKLIKYVLKDVHVGDRRLWSEYSGTEDLWGLVISQAATLCKFPTHEGPCLR